MLRAVSRRCRHPIARAARVSGPWNGGNAARPAPLTCLSFSRNEISLVRGIPRAPFPPINTVAARAAAEGLWTDSPTTRSSARRCCGEKTCPNRGSTHSGRACPEQSRRELETGDVWMFRVLTVTLSRHHLALQRHK